MSETITNPKVLTHSHFDEFRTLVEDSVNGEGSTEQTFRLQDQKITIRQAELKINQASDAAFMASKVVFKAVTQRPWGDHSADVGQKGYIISLYDQDTDDHFESIDMRVDGLRGTTRFTTTKPEGYVLCNDRKRVEFVIDLVTEAQAVNDFSPPEEP